MLFVTAGGTIDKQPVLLPDGSFDHDSKIFGETQLPEMLEEAGFSLTPEDPILTPFMIDSLDMTEPHRGLIGAILDGTGHEEVIITHGTDTMVETAQALSRRSLLAAKTIVLTGSMVPYSMGRISDAVPNLRLALHHVRTLGAGVYISMNQQAFTADNVRKDRDAGVFVRLR